jgi:hypothetical protein
MGVSQIFLVDFSKQSPLRAESTPLFLTIRGQGCVRELGCGGAGVQGRKNSGLERGTINADLISKFKIQNFAGGVTTESPCLAILLSLLAFLHSLQFRRFL